MVVLLAAILYHYLPEVRLDGVFSWLGDTIPLSSGGKALFSVNPLGGAVLFSGDPLAYIIAVEGKNNEVTIKSTHKLVIRFNVPFIVPEYICIFSI